MNIAIISAFRNASWYLSRYFKQVEDLENSRPGDVVRVIAGEGDSQDQTRTLLSSIPGVQVVDVTHGGPNYGSTEQPERFVALSKMANKMLDAVQESDDVVVYVESDLLWSPDVMNELIAKVEEGTYNVYSPLIFAGELFYDIWGFRKNGDRFSPFFPYHYALDGITEVDSVGSCLVMKGEVARRVRIKNDYCLVGWCEDARNQGYRIAVCPHLKVQHT